MNEAPPPVTPARAWPALLMTVVIVAAAIYSFAPRPPPPFEPTQIHADRLIINGVARSGERFVAVGENGVILTATAADGPWTPARVEPARGSTLTRVLFVGEQVAVAAGHDGWLLRSEDAGATWKEVAFEPDRSEPLLGLAGPFDGTLYAFGAFGRFLVSTDEGRTWQAQELVEIGRKQASAAVAPADAYANPFADIAPPDTGLAERHLNGMAQLADGSLVLVGERGLIAHSTDGARTWRRLPEIYSGSFYGVLSVPAAAGGEAGRAGAVLVYGMRGHAFVSRDLRQWTRSEIPNIKSLFGGAVTADGRVVLVGASSAVLVSRDGGRTFAEMAESDRFALASVLPLGDGVLLTGGEGGVRTVTLNGAAPGDAS